MNAGATPRRLAIGILAGGQGTRFGGADKGWIERDGMAQVAHVLDAVRRNVHALANTGHSVAVRVLVSANRSIDRYAALNVDVVRDRWPDFPGPMAGIASLALALRESAQADVTPECAGDVWLLTLPVDARHIPDHLFSQMLKDVGSTPAEAGSESSHIIVGDVTSDLVPPVVAADAEGMQPLFALYAPAHLTEVVQAFERGERSIAHWQRVRQARICRVPALRFGNLNMPSDLDLR